MIHRHRTAFMSPARRRGMLDAALRRRNQADGGAVSGLGSPQGPAKAVEGPEATPSQQDHERD